jgi:hypothetical protein
MFVVCLIALVCISCTQDTIELYGLGYAALFGDFTGSCVVLYDWGRV